MRQLSLRNRYLRPKFEDGSRTKARDDEKLSDEQYIAIMEKVAEENNPIWNKFRQKEGLKPLTVDEDLLRILNDNSYNYRGYYNKYRNSRANADTHWTDEFKTVYHPTFSNQSRYSGKKSQYNPEGLVGGTWVGKDGEQFIPAPWQRDNKYRNGGKVKNDDLTYEYVPKQYIPEAFQASSAFNKYKKGESYSFPLSASDDYKLYKQEKEEYNAKTQREKQINDAKNRRMYQLFSQAKKNNAFLNSQTIQDAIERNNVDISLPQFNIQIPEDLVRYDKSWWDNYYQEHAPAPILYNGQKTGLFRSLGIDPSKKVQSNVFNYIGNLMNNSDLKNIGERMDENEIDYKDAATILYNGIKRKLELFRNVPEVYDSDASNQIKSYNPEYLGITPLSKYAARRHPDYLNLDFNDRLDNEVYNRELKYSKEVLEKKFIDRLLQSNKSYPNAFKIPGTELRSEVIPLNNRRGTYRDSTDHTPVKNTLGSVITFFGGNADEFEPYNDNKKYDDYEPYFNSSVGYVGINDKDELKISNNPKDFKEGNWKIRKIPYHDVLNFNETNGIPKIGRYDKQNPTNNVPLVRSIRNNKEYDAYLPILLKDNLDSFGGAHGGQVIMQVGDKTFYVSGSVNKIHKTFNELKKHYNSDSVRIYLLDNGTFNYGLKPKNGEVTSELHRQYGLSNTRGGDAVFLYK